MSVMEKWQVMDSSLLKLVLMTHADNLWIVMSNQKLQGMLGLVPQNFLPMCWQRLTMSSKLINSGLGGGTKPQFQTSFSS